jgi:hypothetical protein
MASSVYLGYVEKLAKVIEYDTTRISGKFDRDPRTYNSYSLLARLKEPTSHGLVGGVFFSLASGLDSGFGNDSCQP